MRAKEYLEINKSKIQYYDIVKSAIADLSLLRNNNRKTREYFNLYLFADARYTAQKEEFVPREGEIDKSYVYDVRMYILNAVYHDESFIFAFNIILMQSNKYYEFMPLHICKIKEINYHTISNIEKICSQYKEDYPKSNLVGFLHDDVNTMYYEFKQYHLNKEEKWWLFAFNQAYAIFDEMRLRLHEPFKAIELLKVYKNEDKELEFTVIDIVRYLVSEYNFDLDEKQSREMEILTNIVSRHVAQLKKQINKETDDALESVISEKSENDRLKRENEQLKQQLEKDTNAMTCSQQVMAFSYLLNLIGINIGNTKKSIIARFMHPIIGRNEANIRKRLEFNYDDVNVKQNLRKVADLFNEILPGTAEQIMKDING